MGYNDGYLGKKGKIPAPGIPLIHNKSALGNVKSLQFLKKGCCRIHLPEAGYS